MGGSSGVGGRIEENNAGGQPAFSVAEGSGTSIDQNTETPADLDNKQSNSFGKSLSEYTREVNTRTPGAYGTTANSMRNGQKEWASDNLTREVISRASGTTPNGIKTDQSVLPKIDYSRALAEGTQRPYLNKNAYTLTQKARVALVDKDVRKWLKSLGEVDRDDPSFQVKIINIFVSAVYVWDDRFVVLYNVFSDGVAVTGITIGADVVDEEFGVHPEDTTVRPKQQCHVVFAELLYVPEPLLYL